MSLPVWLGLAGPAIFFAWIFPATGLFLIGWACRATVRTWRYGRPTLRLLTLPGVLGGWLRVELHAGARIPARSDFRARLACARGTGDHRRELWQDDVRVGPAVGAPARTGATGAVVPIQFAIPFGLPSSGTPGVDWTLAVTADTRGVDFAAEFSVPIFETPESSAEIDERAVARPTRRAPEIARRPERADDDSRVRVARGADLLELVFPAFRSPGSSLLTFGAFLFWGLITLAFLGRDGWWAIPPKAIMLAGLGFLGWGVLEVTFGWVRLRVRPGRLERTHRWLGIGRTRSFGSADFTDFTLRHAGRLGRVDFYDLRAERAERRPLVLARGIRGKRLAESIREWVEERFEK